MIFNEKIHHYIYIGGLLILSLGLPTSVFLMSLSQFFIYGNWILEGKFKNKWERFRNNKPLWIFMSIYVVHLLWAIFPHQDYSYAINDLRIKLPLLLLPFVVGTSKPLNNKELKIILLTFTSTVSVVSSIALFRFIFKDYLGIIDYRNFIPFISHIRFSLMLVFSFFILTYFFLNEKDSKVLKLAYFFNAIFIGIIVFILKINTGLFLFILLLSLLFIYQIFSCSSKIIRWIFSMGLIIIITFFSYQSIQIWNSFLKAYKIEPPKEVVFNINNKPFFFSNEAKDVENGQRVHFFIQEDELKKEWNLKSNYKYAGYDLKGNKIEYTLKRYLTSKGLTKDSLGISKLTDEDIKAIEKGIANHIYLNDLSVYALLYSHIWDFYNYFILKKVNNSSFFQRIEYQKIAFKIIKDNLWTGVGTGNVKQAFDNAYKNFPTNLQQEQRLRAHNQILTFLLTFGIFSFFWILFAIIYPYFKQNFSYKFLQTIFIIICFISFLTEDTLETQAGVTFFVFFYCLFAFSTEETKIHT